MKIDDFIIIQSLKCRLKYLVSDGRINYCADLMSGRDSDHWYLDFPQQPVFFHFDRIYKKYVLATKVNGNSFRLLINKEYVINLFAYLGENYDIEN